MTSGLRFAEERGRSNLKTEVGVPTVLVNNEDKRVTCCPGRLRLWPLITNLLAKRMGCISSTYSLREMTALDRRDLADNSLVDQEVGPCRPDRRSKDPPPPGGVQVRGEQRLGRR